MIDLKKIVATKAGKAAVISLSVLVVASGAGGAAYYLWPEPAPKPPPPPDSTHQENVDYMASNDFRRLPMDQRIAYIERRMKQVESMSDEEFFELWRNTDPASRHRIRDNLEQVMQARVNHHAKHYFKLGKKEREAYLDERIEEMELWRPKMRKLVGRSRTRSGRLERVPSEDKGFVERERAIRKARAIKNIGNFMTNASGDERGRTARYLTEIGRRRIEKGMSGITRIFGSRKR